MLPKEMYTWVFVCFSIQGRQKQITTVTGICPPFLTLGYLHSTPSFLCQ